MFVARTADANSKTVNDGLKSITNVEWKNNKWWKIILCWPWSSSGHRWVKFQLLSSTQDFQFQPHAVAFCPTVESLKREREGDARFGLSLKIKPPSDVVKSSVCLRCSSGLKRFTFLPPLFFSLIVCLDFLHDSKPSCLTCLTPTPAVFPDSLPNRHLSNRHPLWKANQRF